MSPPTAISGTLIQGNSIGTDVTGTVALGGGGITLSGGFGGISGTQIGGTSAGERNLISGNDTDGITVDGTTGTVIEGNFIGTDISGHHPLGNAEAEDPEQCRRSGPNRRYRTGRWELDLRELHGHRNAQRSGCGRGQLDRR